jgi:hypothetical protein
LPTHFRSLHQRMNRYVLDRCLLWFRKAGRILKRKNEFSASRFRFEAWFVGAPAVLRLALAREPPFIVRPLKFLVSPRRLWHSESPSSRPKPTIGLKQQHLANLLPLAAPDWKSSTLPTCQVEGWYLTYRLWSLMGDVWASAGIWKCLISSTGNNRFSRVGQEPKPFTTPELILLNVDGWYLEISFPSSWFTALLSNRSHLFLRQIQCRLSAFQAQQNHLKFST